MRRMLLTALFASALMATGATTQTEAQSGGRAISASAMRQAAQQHPQVVEEFGGIVPAALNNYVASVGSRIAAQTGVRNAPSVYRVTALNSPVLNAFAVPGGHIYVTRELLAIMNDEAELASVLGHEMAHVAANHGAERQRGNILTQLGAILVGAVTGSQAIGQLATQVSQGLLLTYSRRQETEADTLGVRYLAAAGYDPYASSRLLGSLGAAESLEARLKGGDQRSVPTWARSHPLSQDRVRRTSALAASLRSSSAARQNRDQFLAAIDGMLYGDDPKQGIIEGRQFLHPEVGLKFDAPEGYGMQNGARAVSITGTNGQALFGGGRFAGGFDTYVGQVFRSLSDSQTRINYSTPRAVTINGIPGAHSSARVQTQQGQVDLNVVAYRWDAAAAVHFVTLTRAGNGLGPFGSMVNSLTRMSATEAAAIRPRVIDVVTVRPGDTIQSLASRMAYGSSRLERFQLLNGLNASSKLAPGQKVKIIVYTS